MKIRTFYSLQDGRYIVSIHTESWSSGDTELMRKYGEPRVNVGGKFTVEPSLSIPVTAPSFCVADIKDEDFTFVVGRGIRNTSQTDGAGQPCEGTITSIDPATNTARVAFSTAGCSFNAGDSFVMQDTNGDWVLNGAVDTVQFPDRTVSVDLSGYDVDALKHRVVLDANDVSVGVVLSNTTDSVTIGVLAAVDFTDPMHIKDESFLEPDFYYCIKSDMPITFNFDTRDFPNDDNVIMHAEVMSKTKAETIIDRIKNAIIALRAKTDNFTTEEVITV